jgi:hypothetical protein
MIHRTIANWRMRTAHTADLPSGPGGEILKGAVLTNDDRQAVFRVKPRDGADTPLEVQRLGRPLPFETIRDRLQSDLLELARTVREAGVPLVLATYLAGSDAGFEPITKLMRSLEGREGVVVADCARILDLATAAASVPGGWAGPVPSPVAPSNARALLLTLDQHPTAVGFRAEARVVAEALQKVGILRGLPPGDPLSALPPYRRSIPRLEQAPGPSLAFRYIGAPKDRYSLLLGRPGSSWNKAMLVPVDRASGDWCAGPAPAEIQGAADAKGTATITVPEADAARMRGRVRALAVTRRGGIAGAAQALLSEPLDFQLPTKTAAGR